MPDGTGWLRGVLRDPQRLGGLHLEALPAFCRWLTQFGLAPRHRQRQGRRLAIKNLLDEASAAAARDPSTPFALRVNSHSVPGGLAEVVCLLALECNVPVRVVCTALLCYGAEHLGKELRATNYLPSPRVPHAPTPQEMAGHG